MTTKKVLQFPSRVEKDWIEKDWDRLEKSIRERAMAEGYEEEKVDAVCKRLKKYHAELAPLTYLKITLPGPEGLSEEQLVVVLDLFRQVETKCREQMSILITEAFKVIGKLEWAWEIYRENDTP